MESLHFKWNGFFLFKFGEIIFPLPRGKILHTFTLKCPYFSHLFGFYLANPDPLYTDPTENPIKSKATKLEIYQ